jgi:hypothetical protein
VHLLVRGGTTGSAVISLRRSSTRVTPSRSFLAVRPTRGGITYRAYQDTIDDTLAWKGHDLAHLIAGLTAEQERRLRDAWRARVDRPL